MATAKVSAVSAANIAFIKYWGMQDETAILPQNVSLSMTLEHCVSHCTVTELNDSASDEVWWLSDSGVLEPASMGFRQGVLNHLERLRRHFNGGCPVQVVTRNNFPTGAGIASSASGFSALAKAVCELWQQNAEGPQLSLLAKLSGSGSAARSAFGGFVEWPGDPDNAHSAARQIADADHWMLYDIIAVVDAGQKAVSSREGHRRAASSPYYPVRQRQLTARLEQVRLAIQTRDFPLLAEAVEEEAIDLHVIAMTSSPPIFYWQPATLAVLAAVRQLRADGLEVCATIDAGPNVHVICSSKHFLDVKKAVSQVRGVIQVIVDRTGSGPERSQHHLF